MAEIINNNQSSFFCLDWLSQLQNATSQVFFASHDMPQNGFWPDGLFQPPPGCFNDDEAQPRAAPRWWGIVQVPSFDLDFCPTDFLLSGADPGETDPGEDWIWIRKIFDEIGLIIYIYDYMYIYNSENENELYNYWLTWFETWFTVYWFLIIRETFLCMTTHKKILILKSFLGWCDVLKN